MIIFDKSLEMFSVLAASSYDASVVTYNENIRTITTAVNTLINNRSFALAQDQLIIGLALNDSFLNEYVKLTDEMSRSCNSALADENEKRRKKTFEDTFAVASMNIGGASMCGFIGGVFGGPMGLAAGTVVGSKLVELINPLLENKVEINREIFAHTYTSNNEKMSELVGAVKQLADNDCTSIVWQEFNKIVDTYEHRGISKEFQPTDGSLASIPWCRAIIGPEVYETYKRIDQMLHDKFIRALPHQLNYRAMILNLRACVLENFVAECEEMTAKVRNIHPNFHSVSERFNEVISTQTLSIIKFSSKLRDLSVSLQYSANQRFSVTNVFKKSNSLVPLLICTVACGIVLAAGLCGPGLAGLGVALLSVVAVVGFQKIYTRFSNKKYTSIDRVKTKTKDQIIDNIARINQDPESESHHVINNITRTANGRNSRLPPTRNFWIRQNPVVRRLFDRNAQADRDIPALEVAV